MIELLLVVYRKTIFVLPLTKTFAIDFMTYIYRMEIMGNNFYQKGTV